jgi:hypothetical protein
VLLTGCGGTSDVECFSIGESWKSAVAEGKHKVADDLMAMYRDKDCEKFETPTTS